MPSRINNLIKSWLKDEKDKSVQWTAAEALGGQSTRALEFKASL